MTSFWVHLVFLMVIGFGYSYFWTASTQIYLLMRKRVDETEMDEVYLEEEAPDGPAVNPRRPDRDADADADRTRVGPGGRADPPTAGGPAGIRHPGHRALALDHPAGDTPPGGVGGDGNKPGL